MITQTRHVIIYSGKEERHGYGVAIVMNKEAARSLISWKLVGERIITQTVIPTRMSFMNNCKVCTMRAQSMTQSSAWETGMQTWTADAWSRRNNT